jgi:hypothetical protein
MSKQMGRTDQAIRRFLLHFRVHRLAEPANANPQSPEYLYLVQQTKRLSLAASVGRFSRRNFLLWPFLVALVVAKWIDLKIANAIIASFINEMALLRLSAEARAAADASADPAVSTLGTVGGNAREG